MMGLREQGALYERVCGNMQRVILRVCMVVLICVGCLGGVSVAYAEEIEEESNVVNPHQLPDSSFIYDTSIIDLSTADSYYQGQTVQVVGEVIGDNIKADSQGDYRWIVLSSRDAKANANITVYMTKEDAEKIDTYGKYGKTGTLLRVRGEFHLTCADHDGLTDIHAEHVSAVEKGKNNPDEFDLNRFIPGMIAVAAGAVFFGLFYLLRERRR